MEVLALQVLQQAKQTVVAQGAERVRRIDAGEPVQSFDEQPSVFDHQPIVGIWKVGFGLFEF